MSDYVAMVRRKSLKTGTPKFRSTSRNSPYGDSWRASTLRDGVWSPRTTGIRGSATRLRTVLRPGDALYLPRGFLHSATALGEISAHLEEIYQAKVSKETVTRITDGVMVS